MNEHLSEDDLILHSYGEVDRADRSRVDTHLASCPYCQLEKEKLARVMSMIDTAPPVEAPLGFERTAWARLEPALDANISGWKTFFWFPQWALAGGVAALLVVAFVAGRVSGGDPAAPGSGSMVAAVDSDRVLQSAVGDHLDRTQMMLVELANADVDGADVLAMEQRRAGDLVAANRVILQSAAQSGDGQIVDILEDLERVLMEIANSPANVTSNDLTDLQSRITREDLLFRLRVIASEMRQRQIDDRTTGDPNLRRTPRS
jgi:anti-sigma factor RsiW